MKTSNKKLAFFILINLIVTIFFNTFLNDYSITSAKIKSASHDKSFDTVVLGQSHAECGINPTVIDSVLGSKTMNCARALISVNDIYYILKDSNNQNIKRVLFEIDSFYWNDDQVNGKGEDSNALFFLSWKTKPEYFFKETLQTNVTKGIFDYALKSSTVKEIPTIVRKKTNINYYKSFFDGTFSSFVFCNSSRNYSENGFEARKIKSDTPYWEHQFEINQKRTECEKTFKKICDYCEENGIELICFISPVHPQRIRQENFDVSHEYFEKLCQKNNVRFIDFNYVTKEVLPREDKDFVDIDGHTIVEFSNRITKLLCDFIKGDLKDCYYSSYDEVKANIK